MSEGEDKPLPIIITNEQKKRLIDAFSKLIEIGQDIGSDFYEANTEDADEELLERMAEMIGLAIVAFPWAAALNVFVEEDDEEKIKYAWKLAEMMGSEFSELFSEFMKSESNVKH